MRPQVISEEEFQQMRARVRGTARPRANASLARVRGTFDPVAPGHCGNFLSPYKSRLESDYAQHLDLQQKAGLIKGWQYERFSITLGGGKRYRPDFLVWYPAGLERSLEFVEVKGKWIRNKRDSLTRLAWAFVRWN